MKTNIESIANVIAAAIWADGVYDESEKVTVEEIADALELNEVKFKTAVDSQVAVLENMTENQVNAALLDAAEAVDDEEIGVVFESALQILISDNELTHAEINNMLVIADALGIEAEDAILMLVDLVKEEPELEVNMEE